MIALFSMVRKPFNFDTWIEYHLSLGFDYIYLRVEETPEISSLLDKYKDKVIVEYDNFINKLKSHLNKNYFKIEELQKIVNNLLKKIKKDRFYGIKDTGYTSYFAMQTSALNNEVEFDVEEGASKTKIKSAFIKNLKTKSLNKKVLSKFMDLVC